MNGPAPPLPRAALWAEIERSAREREAGEGFPHDRAARIRTAAGRLRATEVGRGDIRLAALLLERQATLDLEVPTASRVPGVTVVKRATKALMIWYLRFLAAQLTAFGQAAARFGVTVATRVDDLEAELDDLRARVARLEVQAGPGADG